MKDIRTSAKERMKGFCRVCPTCDGRVCAGEVPGMGGLNTGSTFRNNVQALASVQLNMRLVHEVRTPDTATSFLGLELALPVMAAPMGGISFNMGGFMEEHDYVRAILQGCREQGSIGCTGDGVPPIIHEAGFDGIKGEGGHGIPFIKPWEGKELEEKLEKAFACGCTILGMDIDAAGLITLRKMGRPVTPYSQRELEAIIAKVHSHGIRFVLKGVMTPMDALRAHEAGADAIVVSNHGGRVLDHCPGTAAVLPAIAAAVKGRLPIVADGGVRDGVDVLKMLALGADVVGVGRPMGIAALGGGAEGVGKILETMRAQLEQAMLLTGCATVAQVSSEVIFANHGGLHA